MILYKIENIKEMNAFKKIAVTKLLVGRVVW